MPSEAHATISQYTREQPSPRYQELLAQYQHMHEHGAPGIKPQEMFPGVSLPPQAMRIGALLKRTKAATLLDYGCGKAIMYKGATITAGAQTFPSIQAFWGIKDITLYDPAYPPHMTLPQGKFDGVISTDVLEHCPQEDVPWILGELFSYANSFVFANVACYPAKKVLPNGENAHCTIQPMAWWKEHIDALAAVYPNIQYQFIFTEVQNVGGENKKVETVIERIQRR